jgi:hypothetical protein
MRFLALAIALALAQEPLPEDLNQFPVEAGQTGASTRSLVAFVDTPAAFEFRLKSFGDERPARAVATVPGTGEAALYILWGAYSPRSTPAGCRRPARPDASAVFDATSDTVEVLTAPHAGYGFRLGVVKPGEYAVEVSELLPARSVKPTVTLKLAFRVEAP